MFLTCETNMSKQCLASVMSFVYQFLQLFNSVSHSVSSSQINTQIQFRLWKHEIFEIKKYIYSISLITDLEHENKIFLPDSVIYLFFIKLLQSSCIIKIINWLANCYLSIIISLSATYISSCLFLAKEKRINTFMSSFSDVFCLSISSTIQQCKFFSRALTTWGCN